MAKEVELCCVVDVYVDKCPRLENTSCADVNVVVYFRCIGLGATTILITDYFFNEYALYAANLPLVLTQGDVSLDLHDALHALLLDLGRNRITKNVRVGVVFL